ncbi:MAG: hypothetical protein AAF585_18165 [Verrucomicrobiota bacterium]
MSPKGIAMNTMIQPKSKTIALALGLSVCIATTELKASEAEPPKITHENLYQMEELVKQGADPNAHYWLYPGVP